MSEHGIFRLKPDLRLEWRGQGGHHETQKPDHSASLGDSVTSSTRIGFSVHTATAATLSGRRSIICASQSRRVPCCRAYRITAIAPATSSHRIHKRDLENHVLKNLGLVIGRAKFNVFAVRAEELIEGRPD
jgi:hypothetical protein